MLQWKQQESINIILCCENLTQSKAAIGRIDLACPINSGKHLYAGQVANTTQVNIVRDYIIVTTQTLIKYISNYLSLKNLFIYPSTIFINKTIWLQIKLLFYPLVVIHLSSSIQSKSNHCSLVVVYIETCFLLLMSSSSITL